MVDPVSIVLDAAAAVVAAAKKFFERALKSGDVAVLRQRVHDPDPLERLATVQVLSCLAAKAQGNLAAESKELIQDRLDDTDFRVRRAAASSAGARRISRAAPKLAALCAKPNEPALDAAARALVRLKGKF